jgi:hypothetical protein
MDHQNDETRRVAKVMHALAQIEALVNNNGLPMYQLRPRVREQLDNARRALLLDDDGNQRSPKGPTA